MKTNPIFLVSATLLGMLGIAALQPQHPHSPLHAPTPPVPPHPAETPAAGYRHWVRVNLEPHEVSSRLANMCRYATVGEVLADAANPHMGASDRLTLTLPPDYQSLTQPAEPQNTASKWVTVYVNKIGAQAMLRQKKPAFPQGSLIVKEKLAEPHSGSPELLTAMLKRESGYNPAGGDWEYLLLDGAGRQVRA